jgi:hypothetical protein
MGKRQRIILRQITTATSLLGLAGLVLFYQNCSKIAVTDIASQSSVTPLNNPEEPTAPQTPPTSEFRTLLLDTKMNTPIVFILEENRQIPDFTLRFQKLETENKGKFEIIETGLRKISFTPGFGYRGQDSGVALIQDKFGNRIEVTILVNIGNPLSDFQPALAIRGMGCIQCHANINSNIITDFGAGNSYGFGRNSSGVSFSSGAVYGDHGGHFGSMTIPSDKKVFVPKVTVGPDTNTTLKNYIDGKFNESSVASTRQVEVMEKSNVYIGAPTEEDLIASFKLTMVEKHKFYQNNKDSLPLSGLQDRETFYKIENDFTCDGDLVLRGPLYIENMKLKTMSGCRLYVIGSVFSYGPITYSLNSENNNLQIMSTKSINLGLGHVKNNRGQFCEPNSRFANENSVYGNSSLAIRYTDFWTVGGNFVRQTQNPKAFGQSIINEAKLIEAGEEKALSDAACRPETRHVSFEHVLLNAPIVQSRYIGDFKGTVISEFAIMSLDQFRFEYDPIFQNVSVWPFIDSKKYLNLE